MKKSRFGVRLNSKKDGRRIGSFTFYKKPVAETLRLPWWLQCVLMSINGKMERRSGFGIIIAKTRGACDIAINWAESKMGLKQKIEEGL